MIDTAATAPNDFIKVGEGVTIERTSLKVRDRSIIVLMAQ